MADVHPGNAGGKGSVATQLGWSEVPAEELMPGLTRQLVWGDRQMLARFHARAGVRVPGHQHDNEQSTIVLSGRLQFIVDGNRRLEVGSGELVMLPPGTPHEALVLEDAELIEAYSPPRDDWISGDDAYLRG